MPVKIAQGREALRSLLNARLIAGLRRQPPFIRSFSHLIGGAGQVNESC